jgi:hypothetical protein
MNSPVHDASFPSCVSSVLAQSADKDGQDPRQDRQVNGTIFEDRG